jgi:type VI secretion system protein ImpA
MIERYWEPFYPRLDPDDHNDPLERVNIIASLATPAGTFGDPFQFIARIKQAPLADSPQMGRVSLLDVERATAGTAVEGETLLTSAQIAGAFRSAPEDKLREIYGAIVESGAIVKQIDDLLTKAVGAGRAVAFDSLAAVFKELQKAVAPYAAPADSAALAGGEASSLAGGAEGPAISGAIRSTQDVVRVLDQICEFYRKTEPSSPVPLILRRAQRLVNMDFVQLLSDLAPDSLAQINNIAGIRPGEAPAE